MSSPSIPPPFDRLQNRPFSFYPAIIGIEHNEWLLRDATWSEMLVVNDKTHEEIWIPRRYLGQVSPVEDPVIIVGLGRELEFKGGMLVPFKSRILKMPQGVFSGAASGSSESSKPPRGIGLRMDRSDKQAFRLITIAVGCFVALCLIVVGITQFNRIRQRNVAFTAKDAAFEVLSRNDDRFAVVQKLGDPRSDRSKESGTLFFEAMSYPERRYTIILMGSDSKNLKYVGTVDDNWTPVHAVTLRSGGDYFDFLRKLERF
jgi:hypothetical protein